MDRSCDAEAEGGHKKNLTSARAHIPPSSTDSAFPASHFTPPRAAASPSRLGCLLTSYTSVKLFLKPGSSTLRSPYCTGKGKSREEEKAKDKEGRGVGPGWGKKKKSGWGGRLLRRWTKRRTSLQAFLLGLRDACPLCGEAFEWLPGGEYSIEIDPRRVVEADIALLAELGFNRISLGVQDFNSA